MRAQSKKGGLIHDTSPAFPKSTPGYIYIYIYIYIHITVGVKNLLHPA